MKSSRIVCVSLIVSLLIAGSLPASLSARESIVPPSQSDGVDKENEAKPVDVSLAEDGKLYGRLLDSEGVPVGGQLIVVFRDGERVAETKSNSEGDFELDRLRGGLYVIAGKEGGGLYRVWASQTGPPSAKGIAVVYGDTTVVRGNRAWRSWVTSPAFIGIGLAGAIAIPIALHKNEAS